MHEKFVGLYQILDIAANTIVQVLKDCLLRLTDAEGSAMMELLSWQATKLGCYTDSCHITKSSPYHCYRHSLNLAMCEAMKNAKVCRDALDVTHEICKFIKSSPK